MDSVTHTVLGACLGELVLGRQLGKKGMLLGILANNLPDFDVIYQLWMPDAHALLAHRGFTHSISFVILCSFLLAVIFKRIFSAQGVSYRRWLVLFGSGLGTHIFIDAFTSYGTGWFEPFSHVRVSFNSIFIIDPLFSLPVLVSTFALLLLKRHSVKRAAWAKIGITLSAIYLLATVLNKVYVNDVVETNIVAQQISYDDYLATPTPFNNFLWYIVVRGHSRHYVGYYSVFEPDKYIAFERFNKGDSLLTTACDSEELQSFLQFTQGYYSVRSRNDSIIVSDMRFGQQGGWQRKNAPFILNFNIKGREGTCSNLQEGRFEFLNFQSFYRLFERIRARDPVSENENSGLLRPGT